MLFNSYIFILIFLPLVLYGYYVLNYFKKYELSNIFLIGMSSWFYGYFNKKYLLIIWGSVIINFLISKLMEKYGYRQRIKDFILFFGIGINVAIIFYFKYFDFFIENVNAVLGQSFELRNIVLPLGISFFTFQQISYLVDTYKGETVGYTFIEYSLFISFFPQLIAGPIVLHSEMIPQFRKKENRYFIPQNFSKGMYLFALGLFKKVIIADTFGKAVICGYNNIETLSSLEALLTSFSYTFQIYFDFSGYCDMATGIGYMFNIEIPMNFNSPYKATSITEFWNRWHMSLTRFLRLYVYIPLGGNRRGKIRTYFNIMIVYLVSGIWHGANWTFIIWGLLHGGLNCLNRIFETTWKKINIIAQWTITFMLVNVLWIFFRAEDIGTAVLFIKKLCKLSSFTIREELYGCFKMMEFSFLEKEIPVFRYISNQITGLYLWVFIIGTFFIVLNFRNSREIDFVPTIRKSLTVIVLVFFSIISLSGISTFLYFNF